MRLRLVLHRAWLSLLAAIGHGSFVWLLDPLLRWWQGSRALLVMDGISVTKQLVQQAVLARHGSSSGWRLASAALQPLGENRGLRGRVMRILLSWESCSPTNTTTTPSPPPPSSVVLKTSNTATWALRRSMQGSSSEREAQFFAALAGMKGAHSLPPCGVAALAPLAPAPLWAASRSWFGTSLALMADADPPASSTESTAAHAHTHTWQVTPVNFICGNQCWGLPSNLSLPPLTLGELLIAQARACAALHAATWRSPELLEEGARWLRAVPWYLGQGRASWELGVAVAERSWTTAKATPLFARLQEKDPALIAFVDASVDVSNWAALQKQLRDPSVPFCLTHGDWHASNLLWQWGGGGEGALVALDWSEVGVWEPAADIAQLMVSDIRPEERRQHEAAVLAAYRDALLAGGVPPHDCEPARLRERYAISGLQRWTWLLTVLLGLQLPDAAHEYFFRQVGAFRDDHWAAVVVGGAATPEGGLAMGPLVPVL